MRKLCLLLLTVCLATFVNAQNVNVNPGAGSYATLKDAFDAINAGTHTGSITVDIVGNTTETLSAVLNASGSGAASYTQIIISPSGGASRTITGAIAGALIDLNGADNVTIDGLNAGGNALTISNTSTGAASTIRLIADASTNIIQNCTIQGSASTASNGVLFFSTGTTTGNDDNNINNNIINAAGANLPINGVFSLGTASPADNSGNTLEANNISDYFNAASVSSGINLASTGNSTWTITNNRLFQTATLLYTGANTHNGIFVGVGEGYIISGNVIGYANAGGTGYTSLVGNSVAVTGFPTSYTSTGTPTATRFIAINCAFTAGGAVSSLQNNTIAGIALYTSSGAATTYGVLCGINITSGNANVGTAAANTIGVSSGTGSLYAASSTAGAHIVGINASSANTVTISNNIIGGIESSGRTASTAAGFAGIRVSGAGNFTVTSNLIGNTTAGNIRTGYFFNGTNLGIGFAATTATGTSVVYGIDGTSTATTGNILNISSNTVRGILVSGSATTVNGIATSGAMTGTTPSVTVNSNSLGTAALGFLTYAFANSGALQGISVTNTVATTHSIQTNDFRGITYSVTGTGAHTYINITGATAASNVATIASNTFTNLNINTTGAVTFINHNYAINATGQLIINNNSIVTAFTRVAAGSITITTSNSTSGTGSVNNYTNNNFSNIIVPDNASSAITGFNNTDGGTGSTKTITGNTFNNWHGGTPGTTGTTGTINCMNFTYWNGVSSLSSNTITNITGRGAITGITMGSAANNATSVAVSGNTINNLTSIGTGGNVTGITCANTSTAINISGNTIHTLSSTGASSTVTGIIVSGAATTNVFQNTINTLSGSGATSPVVNGITVSGGTTVNVYKNKVYDLSQSGAIVTTSPAINGLLFSGGTTVNASNNLVGDLRTPAAGLTDAIRGISVTSATASTTYNVYYNTVYLNATSSGTNFGTTGIFHTASATATTAALNLRNNIIVNNSTAAGTGVVTCYRRSAAATYANYVSTSNNNDFYTSTGSVMHDGTTAFNIATFKAAVAPRESSSFLEDPEFQSTAGANINFLKYRVDVAKQIESGAANIATYTDDYANTIRQGNGGYTGTGTAPDMGAWELEGIGADLSGPSITYTTLGTTACITDRTLSPVTITDGSGVNTTPGTKPRLYYKKSTDADTYAGNTSADNGWKYVEATNASSPFSFTTDYSLLQSAVVNGDSLSYFVVAQDLAGIPNIGINSGTFAVAPASVALTAAAFPLGGTVNGYRIATGLSGTVTIGAAGTYSSLTGAAGLFNAINTNGISAALTVNILDASVTETGAVALNAINYTGCAAGPYPVIIAPSSGVNTVLSGTVASGALIKINGADNVTFDGSNNGSSSKNMTITNSSATSPTAIWIASVGTGAGAADITIKNCIINTGSNAATSYGIFAGGISIGTAGDDNDNLTIQNNTVTKAYYGIYCAATATGVNNNLLITQNTIGSATATDYIGFRGIFAAQATGATVELNTVFNIEATLTNLRAMEFGAGFVNSSISRNTITNINYTATSFSAGKGITLSSGTASANVTVSNNSISGLKGHGSTTATNNTWGIMLLDGGGYNLYYNSINIPDNRTSTSSTDVHGGIYIASTVTALDIRNNSVSVTGNPGNAAGRMYAVYSLAAAPFTVSNRNDLYVSGTQHSVGFFSSANQNTLADWQTATSQDANSISTDPFYNSATNLVPQPISPLVGAGTPVSVTIDLNGITRSVTTPTIGAYEQTADAAAPVINITTLGITCSTGDRLLSNVVIVDASGVPTAGVLQPRVYYRKNAGSWFSSQGTLTGGTGNNGTWDFTIVAADMGGLVVGDAVSYYVIAQDVLGNITSSPSAGLVATNVNTVTTPPTTPYSYTINNSLSGTYTVGAGGAYTTITAAVAAYNVSCLGGPVVFSLTDATYPSETYPITINPNSFASSTNTLTIKPAVGVTPTISTSLASNFMFRVNGNYVIFDGSNTIGGTTRDMTISNTSATNPSAILYGSLNPVPIIGGTIKNTIFLNGANGTSNVVVGGSASTTSGATDGYCNNFTFQNNSSRFTNHGIYMTMVVGATNGSGTLITGNDFAGTAGNAIKQSGVTLVGVDGATVTNNTIGNFDQVTAEIDKGIWLQAGTINTVVSGNTISTLGHSTTSASGNAYGIWVASGNAASAVTISGNTISGFSSAGAATTVGTTGIYVSGATAGVTIEKNIIRNMKNTNTGGFGASGIQLSSSSATAAIVVKNNMISDIAGYGKASAGVADNGYGIVVSAGAGYSIYYNSIHLNSDQTLVGGLPAAINITSGVSAAGAIDLRNNIFANSQTIGTERYAIYSGAPNTVFSTIDYNDYYTTGPNLGFLTINLATLANIQTGFGGNINSENVQPQFISSTDLHLAPSLNPGLDAQATPIGSVLVDIDNDTRDATTPDLGADEFTPVAGVDMGATALVSPAATGCYTAAETVTVTIKNYSASTIDFAVNNVTVTVTATGGYNQNLVLNSGTLASGATQNVNMPATIDLSANGTYTFNANTSVAGDVTPANDAMTPAVRNVLSLGGTKTVGSGGDYATITAAVAAYNAATCFTGPVVFSLTDASYTTGTGETFPITINANAAAGTNTLTIKPTQASTSINGSATSAIFVLNGADYIILDGSISATANTVCPPSSASRNLTIANTNAGTTSAVVWMQTAGGSDAATNNTIRNCNLAGSGIAQTLFGAGSGSTAISTTSLGTGNNNNSFINNNISGVQYGIYSQGASAANKNTGTVINQNTINTATGRGGIWVGFDNGATISANRIENITATSDCFGITLGIGNSWGNTTTAGNEVINATVTNNIINNIVDNGSNSAAGILLAAAVSGTTLIANNMISGVSANGTASDFCAGILLGGGSGSTTNLYYNTVSMSGTITGGTAGTQQSVALAVTAGTAPTLDLRNNIFENSQLPNAGGTTKFYAVGLGYSSTAGNYAGLTSNNNDLFAIAGANYGVAITGGLSAGTVRTTLADWTTETGRDGASVSVAPVYISATNLHMVAGSNPAINNAGTALAVTNDIDCATRDVTTPDIGADEFTPSANDAGVTVIVLPIPFCAGSPQTIQATIKNYGTATLSSVLVDWTVTPGGAQPQVNPAISLAPGASATITLGNFTFVAGTTYSINAVTSLPNGSADGDPSNDAFTDNNVNTGLSGNYNVGAGGDFTTLTAAAAAYNTRSICGAVTFTLTDATYSGSETFPVVFNNNVSASAVNTLTILPGTTVSVTGSSSTAAISLHGAKYITIDGRIGGAGTTHSLTITNTAATTSPAVLFINEASNNTVKYTDLKSDNSTTTSGVVFFSTTTGANGNDNNTIDNCNIGPNIANPTNGIYSSGTNTLPAQNNSGNIISNNNIFNFYNSTSTSNAGVGVNISSGNTGWTINANSFYQTVTRTTFGAAATFNGILLSNSSGNNFVVTNNFIGGTAPNCGGTPMTLTASTTLVFRAFQATVGATTPTSLQGNTIRNIAVTTTSTSTAQSLISAVTGSFNIGNTTGNTLGSTSSTGSVTFTQTTTSTSPIFTGILVGTGTPGDINVSNNTIGGITVANSSTGSVNLRGIQVNGAPVSLTLNNNTIGSASTANSFIVNNASTAATNTLYGIEVSSGTTVANSISGNTVANIAQNSVSTTAGTRGISYAGTGLSTISNNIVHDISSASANATVAGGATAVMGILYTGTSPAGATISLNEVYAIRATNTGAVQTNPTGIGYSNPSNGVITKNKIYDITNASTMTVVTTPPTAIGLLLRAALGSGVTVSNNMISLGNAQTTNTQFMGIINSFNTATLFTYHNTVNIEGAATAGALPSFCFMRGDNSAASAITSPVDIRNNIFNNTRTGGTGIHYAIGNNYGNAASSATGWAAGATNYNALNGSGGVGYWNTNQNFAGWKAASLCDANSVSGVAPTFVNTAIANLHLNMGVTPTQLESGGTAGTGITIDWDNDARPGPAGSVNGGATAPDMGADEFDGVPLDLFLPIITYTPLINTTCTTNRPFTASASDNSGINVTVGTKPRVYYKRSTDANAWNDNTNGTDGWKYAEASNAVSPFTFTIDYSLLNGGTGVTAGNVVQYFVVAQDLAGTPNVAINSGTFAATPSSVALTGAAFPIGGTINSYAINGSGLNTTLTLGAAGDYTSLTGVAGLFNAINANGLTGNTTVNILDASVTETGAIALNQVQSGGCSLSNYTLLIKPNGTTTLTGALDNRALIRILSSNVTLDGSNSGGTTRDLTITNTSVTAPTVVLIGSTGTTPVTGTTVKNSIVINGSQASSAVYVSDTALGNAGYFNNITVQNNSIQQAFIGVYANAVVATGNGSGTLFTGNDLNTAGANSIRLAGLYAQGVDGVTISNNNIANMSNALAESPRAIWLATGTVSGTVSGNNISTLASTNTGAFAVAGIYVTPGTGATGITVNANTISGLTNAGTGTTFAGILSTSPNTSITNNTISNLTQNGSSSSIGAYGIVQSGSSNATISGNTISGILSTTSATPSGINIQGTSTGVDIFRNSISNIKNTNTTGWGAHGINLASSSTTANINVYNNLVYDVAADGFNGITATDNGYGIMLSTGGGYNIRFNSVNMNTDQPDIVGRPAAINISSGITTAASLDIRDNIFANTQTTGNRYAIVSGAANTVFSNINYNDYYSTGVVGYNGTTEYANLAAWQAASAQDANSVAVNPQFTTPTNLNLLAASPLFGSGVTIAGITSDFVNSTRNSPPSIGAYENRIVVAATVFLHGAYSSGLSRHKDVSAAWAAVLNANALNQPYSGAPFNYAGTESVTAGFFTSTVATTDVTDWVLVELRDAVTPTTVVSTRAAFVREDGLIVDLDGVSPVSFRGFNANSYFITIRHRNHLGVRSATAQLINGSATPPTPYDFSSAQAQAYQDPAILALPAPNNNNAMNSVGGKFVLWGGNGNANNTTRANGPLAQNDYSFLITTTLAGNVTGNIPNVYSRGDYNMDGTVRANGPLAQNDYSFLLTTSLTGSVTKIITQHQ